MVKYSNSKEKFEFSERMAKVLLDEYRSGKLGHFTLESPEELQ